METVEITDLRKWVRWVHDYARGEGELTRKTALTAVGNLLHSAETAILCTKKYEAYDFFPIVTKLSRALNEEALYPDRRLSLRIAQTMRIYLELTSHRLQADEGNAASLGPLKETLVSRLKTRLEQAEMCDNLALSFELRRFREAAKFLDGNDDLFTVDLAVNVVKASVSLYTEKDPSGFLAIFKELHKKMYATWYPFSFECGMVGRIARKNESVFGDLEARISEFTEQKAAFFKKDTTKQYGLMAAVATLADCAEESTIRTLQLRAVDQLAHLSRLELEKTRCKHVRACALEHLSLLRKHRDPAVAKQAQVELERALEKDGDKIGTLGLLRPPIAVPVEELNNMGKAQVIIEIESVRKDVRLVLDNQKILLANTEGTLAKVDGEDPFEETRKALQSCPNWKTPSFEAMRSVCEAAMHPDSLEFLKESASKGFDFNFRSEHGSVLLAMVGRGPFDAVIRLLDAGAHPDGAQDDPALIPPLLLALYAGRWDVAHLLLERGAQRGICAGLQTAVARRRPDMLRALSMMSVDLNLRIPQGGEAGALPPDSNTPSFTPLGLSLTLRDLSITNCLLTLGADPNLQIGNQEGHQMLPLHFAIGAMQPALVRCLLQHRANPNIPRKGERPLDLAVARGYKEIAQWILVAGGDGTVSSKAQTIKWATEALADD